MSDSHDPISFRVGWQPVGKSRDVTLGFQHYLKDFITPLDTPYYFKAIRSFDVPHSDDEKFEAIDEYIVRELGCEYGDVITVSCRVLGPVIVMSERVLVRAGIRLPRWGEPMHRKPRGKSALMLVMS